MELNGEIEGRNKNYMNDLEDGLMEPLHEHNQKTYENICRMYNEEIQRVAVVQPTGSGKSLLMAKLIEDNPDSRFFVLSTSHKINDQFKEKLDEGMLERIDCNIYCNMPNMKQEVMESLQPDYIFLDEMHRALAKEWSKGIIRLLEMYPNAKVLGLSATPIRYLDKCRNVAEELFDGNLACDMSLSQAILDGILPMARYVCGVYSYEKDTESLNRKIEKSTNSDEEKKELLRELKVLKENLDKGHGVSDIFRKYIVSGNEKLVVFLKDTTHLRIMKPVIEQWFLEAGFNVRLYEVHSKYANKDREFQMFKADTEDGIKLCLSVNMLSEGVHGDIDGVIMLRNTISANMYFQMIGRAFACGKKTIPLIIDLVANSQFISDAVDNFPNELRKEIEKRKKECEKEGKEYDPGFDVDEFIVMDEFMDVVSGFRAIEERLEGGWENGLKHFDKYVREHNGDVLVPERYKDDDGFLLGNWVSHRRKDFDNGILSLDKVTELENRGFIWDVYRHRFEYTVQKCIQFYKENGRLPIVVKNDDYERKLAYFIRRNKKDMENDVNYPIWKKDLIMEIPDFLNYNNESDFDRFYAYAIAYKDKYGHMNVKSRDIINGYNIGNKYFKLRKEYQNDKLSKYKIKKLQEIGFMFEGKLDKQFNDKMDLVSEAVKEGVLISYSNQIYKGENLYKWLFQTVKQKFYNEELLQEQVEIIQKLIGRSLYKLFNMSGDFVKVIDVIEKNEIGIYRSQTQVVREMQEKFNINTTIQSVWKHLNGKVTTPYKGRFMFYYATDEEIKKYLEDNKVS